MAGRSQLSDSTVSDSREELFDFSDKYRKNMRKRRLERLSERTSVAYRLVT